MKLPKKVKVGYHTFKIVPWDSLESASAGRIGEFSPLTLEIRVRSDLPLPQMKETLLHEIIHAIWSVGSLSTGDEEKITSIMSPMLLDVFKTNPKVRKFLLNEDCN